MSQCFGVSCSNYFFVYTQYSHARVKKYHFITQQTANPNKMNKRVPPMIPPSKLPILALLPIVPTTKVLRPSVDPLSTWRPKFYTMFPTVPKWTCGRWVLFIIHLLEVCLPFMLQPIRLPFNEFSKQKWYSKIICGGTFMKTARI